MFFHSALALLALASRGLGNPTNPAPMNLQHDDVIVMNADGSTTIMKDYEYTELQNRAENAARQALAAGTPPRDTTTGRQTKFGTRGCEESSEVQVLSDTTFLNWDVAISPVVAATGGAATVAVSEGYSIADSVSTTAGISVSGIEKVLGLSFSISYSQTWTTTNTQTLTFTVPNGQYGVIVSEPSTRRIQGNYLTGCTDSWTKTPFTADSYTSQSWGGMEWPQGVIRLCNSTSYPIPYCVGQGSHS